MIATSRARSAPFPASIWIADETTAASPACDGFFAAFGDAATCAGGFDVGTGPGVDGFDVDAFDDAGLDSDGFVDTEFTDDAVSDGDTSSGGGIGIDTGAGSGSRVRR